MDIVDVLIVGQGLAGSVLAYCLHETQQKILVIDDGYLSSSSIVSAGLVDPFSGRRFVKVEIFDEAYPVAKSFYQNLERNMHTSFFHEIPACRIFASEDEKGSYEKKKNLLTHAPFLGDVFDHCPDIESPLGGVEVRPTAYLDVPIFLQTLRTYFQQTQSFYEASFDYAELTLNDEGVLWRGIQAKKLIFCQGYKGAQNPFFKLDWSLVKGDILTFSHTLDLPRRLIHKGKWVLPVQDHVFKVGASYIREFTDGLPTQEGRLEIETFLKETLPIKSGLTCLAHQAGIRPILKDNKPVLKFHPEYSAIGVFNGLGSRGVLQAPYYAKRFVREFC